MGEQVSLGDVQETLLIPLYGRAQDARRRTSILHDERAAEMVEQIDYDFAKHRRSNTAGSVLRASIFDAIVTDFLADHPDGTVVDLGCGLSTRFERLDNGRVTWLDVDLDDVMALRRKFIADGERYTQRVGSIHETDWYSAIDRDRPVLLISEAVLMYFPEDRVKQTLRSIASAFPGALFAFDTAGQGMVDMQDKTKVYDQLSARFYWACDDPAELSDCGLKLIASYNFAHPPAAARQTWSTSMRLFTSAMGRFPVPKSYRFNVFECVPEPATPN
ncbi:MAG: class I SAM-dependent methyltransferase [Gordonia sp. (in: high G+C Gram-positive bacteria)]|uniref:class I SAM-dependent methyltransferase n=1 Tax=Gordonia sp. (in: high G+C Gram-positive bacteria) TaxID=84139 RepID=UPI0039E724EA